jgi:hypothetical protein
VPGLALAGVTGAGKSSILGVLASRLAADRDRSVCVLRNDLIQNPGLRSPGGPSPAVAFAFLGRTLDHLEALTAWGKAPDEDGALVILCESWAVNLLAELDVWSPEAFLALDRRRAACRMTLVHLVFDAACLEARSVSTTRQWRGPGWARYLDGLGVTPGDQAHVFRARRERIARYLDLACEPKLEVATDGMDWVRYSDTLVDVLGTEAGS